MANPQPGQILIVDDEPALLLVMEQYLRRMGHNVTSRRSGREAWQLFESRPADYWLVIADITMPGMSGKDMLLRMLELNPAVCILICSGYPFDMAVLPEPARPHVGFLQKPFTPKMLAEAVQGLCPPA